MPFSVPELQAGWQAELALSFVRAGEQTVLHERRHRGPLRVQKPFYPEGERVCHVYLLHPPGGLVAGDRLMIDARIEAGAHALLTTPAAGKLYRSGSSERQAVQEQHLRVAAGASLEWLPQETIAFDGARTRMATRVELEGDACFVGWEVLCLGRPAAGERFEHGEVAPSWEVLRDGQLAYVERGQYSGGSDALAAPWGLRGQPVVGTLLCAAPCACRHVDAARGALASSTGLAAVSGWGDVLVVRYLGPSVEDARRLFGAVWSALRPSLSGRPASAPRIWST
jgi:urease accessory protein